VTDLLDCKEIGVVKWSEKCVQCKQRRCATDCKPETKNTGDSSNVCVCLYRSLKLLTDENRLHALV